MKKALCITLFFSLQCLRIVSINFGVSTHQGGKCEMQDAYDYKTFDKDRGAWFAVFDGHGGTDVVNYVEKNLNRAVSYSDRHTIYTS